MIEVMGVKKIHACPGLCCCTLASSPSKNATHLCKFIRGYDGLAARFKLRMQGKHVPYAFKAKGNNIMQKIRPFLWFNNQAQDAANFYVSIFKNAKILSGQEYGEAGPGEPGTPMTVSFELEGQEFIALNGGPEFTFSPAISFFITCETQDEVDYYWEKLSDGGKTIQCGWLEDKFGITWQVVPSVLGDLLDDPNEAKADAVMRAMMNMIKLDIAGLQEAYDKA